MDFGVDHWTIIGFLKLEVISGERTKIPATSSVCPNQACLVSVLQLYIYLFFFKKTKTGKLKKIYIQGVKYFRKKKKKEGGLMY